MFNLAMKVLNQQRDVYAKLPPLTLPGNQDETHIQKNNNDTSTPNTNKLNIHDGYNRQ